MRKPDHTCWHFQTYGRNAPRSAVCIIAMSVEPREIGEAAALLFPHPIALNLFLSKDSASPKATTWPAHSRRILQAASFDALVRLSAFGPRRHCVCPGLAA
jgi:hypothetical protein